MSFVHYLDINFKLMYIELIERIKKKKKVSRFFLFYPEMMQL